MAVVIATRVNPEWRREVLRFDVVQRRSVTTAVVPLRSKIVAAVVRYDNVKDVDGAE
jgi:hypothetical protein